MTNPTNTELIVANDITFFHDSTTGVGGSSLSDRGGFTIDNSNISPGFGRRG